MIVDTSALIAFFDRSEPAHEAVTQALHGDTEALILSPYVLAEVDYLVATRHGLSAELAVLDELSGGAWDLAAMNPDDLRSAREVISRYGDQAIGLTDASLVVLADRYRTRSIATLDHRHFTVLRTSAGEAFTIVP